MNTQCRCVLFINVDCQQKLILIVQKFRAYLLADFERPFGSDLTGLEADDTENNSSDSNPETENKTA